MVSAACDYSCVQRLGKLELIANQIADCDKVDSMTSLCLCWKIHSNESRDDVFYKWMLIEITYFTCVNICSSSSKTRIHGLLDLLNRQKVCGFAESFYILADRAARCQQSSLSEKAL